MNSSSSSIQSTIQDLADRYRCDRNDPIFSVLEKMDDYHQEVKVGLEQSIPQKMEMLRELTQQFHSKMEDLNQAADKLSASGNIFEENAEKVRECTQELIQHWKQLHLRQALVAVLVSWMTGVGIFAVYYYQSADHLLSQAGVSLKSVDGTKGRRLTLSGQKLMDVARGDNRVVMEFSK